MTSEEFFGNWMKAIDKEELNNVLDKLSRINPDIICPAPKDIFRAFRLCSYDDCKVIFIGQEPYPQKNIGTGIMFGNKADTPMNKLSPSLEVIKESVIDYSIPHGSIDFDITLESWAKQGILMLNSSLTCKVNEIGSHVMLWRTFTASFLKRLSTINIGIIYVLFGKQAQTFKPYINSRYNTILEIGHPAYYARNNMRMPNIFNEVNRLLEKKYGESIVWFTEY